MNFTRGYSGTRWVFRVQVALLLPALVVAAYFWIDLALNPSLVSGSSQIEQIYQLLAGLLVAPLTVAVGLFCIRRVPGNVVAPILSLWGCGIVQIVSTRSAPWIDAYSAMYAGIIWPACFFLFSYFPDGRAYPRRFERWIDGLVLFTYAMSILSALSSKTAPSNAAPNILFVPALQQFSSLFSLGNVIGAATGLFFGVVSLVLRYRAAEQPVRLQMKWLLAGLLVFAGLALPQIILVTVTPYKSAGDVLGSLVAFWLMVFPVISVGNALLRHRLYDIDIIIRRTLVYSTLTVLLALTYWGGVVILQAALRPVTGEGNDLAIVATTLLVAGIFFPLRRVIQNVIDRRFYRRKYDAAKTLATFGSTVRDEVELARLTGHLLSVVDQTMKPSSISLWLREANAESTGEQT